MNEKHAQMDAYFDAQLKRCSQRKDHLLADGRTDDAVFEKVKANVYGIFKTILSVAVSSSSGDADAVRKFFMVKEKEIFAAWLAAHEQASQHGDVEKMQLEQIKLETIREIEQRFLQIWEGAA